LNVFNEHYITSHNSHLLVQHVEFHWVEWNNKWFCLSQWIYMLW